VNHLQNVHTSCHDLSSLEISYFYGFQNKMSPLGPSPNIVEFSEPLKIILILSFHLYQAIQNGLFSYKVSLFKFCPHIQIKTASVV
jgi:hypothetical protein